MTELQAYKFVQDKEICWHGDKLILWLSGHELSTFADLLGDDYLCEGDCKVTLLSGGNVGIELRQILEDFDIDPENILKEGMPNDTDASAGR